MSKPETTVATSYYCMCGSRTPGFHYLTCRTDKKISEESQQAIEQIIDAAYRRFKND